MASLTINLEKIEHNARLVAELLRPHKVKLTGVTKGCLGDPLVAKAMLAGGAAALADSRLENISRLRASFPDLQLQLLRTPGDSFSAAGARADLFFVSGFQQAAQLAVLSPGVRVCLMIDTGDGREGVPAVDAPGEARKISSIAGIRFAGLATNLACARKTDSLNECLALFDKTLRQIDPCPAGTSAGGSLPVASAGGSGLLQTLIWGNPPHSVQSVFKPLTHIRCGEAILLGSIPGKSDLFLPGAHRDAFQIEGRVLEVNEKRGRLQALLDFGLQDVGSAAIFPMAPGLSPASITSDYMTLTCDRKAPLPSAGDSLTFIPTYYALMAAMTSPFIEKRYI